ncbi:MAG: hypothetical protein WC415_00415 [Patescibacteria group bacterium]|jgi:hypothetical protein
MARFLIILFIIFLFPVQIRASEITGRISTNPKKSDFVSSNFNNAGNESGTKEVKGIKITNEAKRNIWQNIYSLLVRFVKFIIGIVALPWRI